jgi:Protein of unknown function (DUF4238)
MADNKKHHFVPQFYLRRFSADSRSVGVWNLRSREVYLRASIKGQCHREYFYGHEGELEKHLSYMEGNTSEIMRQICADPKRFVPNQPPFSNFLFFVIVQLGRGLTSTGDRPAHRKTHQCIYGARSLFGVEDQGKEAIRRITTALADMGCITDLDVRILQIPETSKIRFVTSDSPIILSNQFLRPYRDLYTLDIIAKGLQVFVPLDTRHAVHLFDPAPYAVDSPDSSGFLNMSDADVIELNRLHVEQALSNIYFHPVDHSLESIRNVRRDLPTVLEFSKVKRSSKGWRKVQSKKDFAPFDVIRSPHVAAQRDYLLKTRFRDVL